MAAALAALAEASGMHRAHQLFHAEKRNAKHNDSEICQPGCTTYTTVITGEPTTLTPTQVPTTTKAPPKPTTTAPVVVPTPVPEVCETRGTYTFPARIVTLTETTTVCAASTTTVPKGTHTLGGVTTVVTTSTTVTCPYATVTTGTDGVVTNVVSTTTTVCPSAGTYTIAPVTKTVVVEQTVVVVPVVTTYCPGTYTAPAVITTVTETSVTVWCPFETPAPAPLPTKQPESPKEPVKQEPPKDVAPPPGKLGGGKVWAITYTPFRDDGTCKSQSEVYNDVKEIKADGFRTLRTYSTDCNTLEHVGAACADLGLKMIIGVFVGKKGCDNDNPDVAHQIASIKNWGRFDLVEMAVVGNEAGHNDFCTPYELKALIVQVKTILVSAGCNAPVTTTDTTAVWERADFSSVICGVVDVVAVNAHAYFNADVRPSQAGPFVKGQLDIVKGICGKDGYVMETGWPNGGEVNGLAVPGQSQQYEAIKSIQETMGGSVAFFSWRDDPWKKGWSPCNCEDKWGCSTVFKQLNARGLLN